MSLIGDARFHKTRAGLFHISSFTAYGANVGLHCWPSVVQQPARWCCSTSWTAPRRPIFQHLSDKNARDCIRSARRNMESTRPSAGGGDLEREGFEDGSDAVRALGVAPGELAAADAGRPHSLQETAGAISADAIECVLAERQRNEPQQDARR
jgi:hypothetical protein